MSKSRPTFSNVEADLPYVSCAIIEVVAGVRGVMVGCIANLLILAGLRMPALLLLTKLDSMFDFLGARVNKMKTI